MARKDEHTPSGELVKADAVLDQVLTDVEVKLGKEGRWLEDNDVISVLPVPSFAVRYLLQNNGWPLGRLTQVVGEQASFKSSFSAEVCRWHRMCGGKGYLYEVETKPTPDLRMSIVNWDPAVITALTCTSLEDWQRKLTLTTQTIQKRCEQVNGPGRTLPICNVVDSMMAKASEHTIKKVLQDGHASRAFAIEANLVNTYMKVYPKLMLGWPMSLIGVNHLKMATDERGLPLRRIPGGWSLKFQETFEIEMGRISQPKDFSTYTEVKLYMKTYKNSLGTERKRIIVPFRWWFQDVPDGKGGIIRRQYSRFEWWTASITLLQNMKDPIKKAVDDIIDLHEKSGGSRGKLFWSKALGVPSVDAMPAHDLGLLLEKNTDMLSELYDATGVNQRPFFEPAVNSITRFENYAHVKQHAEAALNRVDRAQELIDSPPDFEYETEIADQYTAGTVESE